MPSSVAYYLGKSMVFAQKQPDISLFIRGLLLTLQKFVLIYINKYAREFEVTTRTSNNTISFKTQPQAQSTSVVSSSPITLPHSLRTTSTLRPS